MALNKWQWRDNTTGKTVTEKKAGCIGCGGVATCHTPRLCLTVTGGIIQTKKRNGNEEARRRDERRKEKEKPCVMRTAGGRVWRDKGRRGGRKRGGRRGISCHLSSSLPLPSSLYLPTISLLTSARLYLHTTPHYTCHLPFPARHLTATCLTCHPLPLSPLCQSLLFFPAVYIYIWRFWRALSL